jgi:hypothetical protein
VRARGEVWIELDDEGRELRLSNGREERVEAGWKDFPLG